MISVEVKTKILYNEDKKIKSKFSYEEKHNFFLHTYDT